MRNTRRQARTSEQDASIGEVLFGGEIIQPRVLFFFFSSRRRHTRSVSAFLLNRSSDLLRLLWKTPIFPSNSRFPRLCAKCLLKLKRLVSILPMTKSKK